MTRKVAFLVDPSVVAQSIRGTEYNLTGYQLAEMYPNQFFIDTDDDNVEDLCMNIGEHSPNPSGIFVINGVNIPLTAVDFIGGRPPTRPPAK